MALTTCCMALFSALLLCFLSSVFAQSSCPIAYGCQCGNNLLRNRPGMTVICPRGGLTTIPVLEIPRETRYLFIQAPPTNPNRFRLQLGTFSRLEQLEELHLTDSNALRSIGEDTFFELSRTLRVLNLTNNVIEYLIENNFRNLENLQQLYLDNNYITGLNSATFNMLKQLQLLSLRNNYIRELPPAFSVGLSQLDTLDLSDNPLGTSQNPEMRGTVPSSAFNYTQQLRVLLLHNTSLEVLPYSTMARFAPNLQRLDVGASRFCQIEDGQFNRFKSLKQLDLHSMTQKCLQGFVIRPRALQGMNDLQRVDLGDNHLNDLNGLLNGIPRLESLGLARNNLQQLNPLDFQDIAGTLVALDLSQNDRLALRPHMFQFLPQLLQLDLSRMGLNDATVPNDLFSGYQNRIRMLNLSTNGLSKLDSQILNNLPNLEVLDLSYNLLERVPEGLGAVGCARLSPSGQPGGMQQQPRNNLKELYLNDNRLREFPSGQLGGLRSTATPIRVLTLQNNPWICNCGIFDLYNWITTREGQDAICGVSNGGVQGCPACQEPVLERNKPISALNPNFFAECRSAMTPLVNPVNTDDGRSSRIAAIIIACAIAAALLILALLLFVWWHRNRLVSYYTREEKRTDYDESLYADTSNAATVTPPIGVGVGSNSSVLPPEYMPSAAGNNTMYPPASTMLPTSAAGGGGGGSHYGGSHSRTESHV